MARNKQQRAISNAAYELRKKGFDVPKDYAKRVTQAMLNSNRRRGESDITTARRLIASISTYTTHPQSYQMRPITLKGGEALHIMGEIGKRRQEYQRLQSLKNQPGAGLVQDRYDYRGRYMGRVINEPRDISQYGVFVGDKDATPGTALKQLRRLAHTTIRERVQQHADRFVSGLRLAGGAVSNVSPTLADLFRSGLGGVDLAATVKLGNDAIVATIFQHDAAGMYDVKISVRGIIRAIQIMGVSVSDNQLDDINDELLAAGYNIVLEKRGKNIDYAGVV